jgi:hypothetical protein
VDDASGSWLSDILVPPTAQPQIADLLIFNYDQ